MRADDERPLALLVVGLVLLAGIPVGLLQPRPAAVGTPPAAASASTGPSVATSVALPVPERATPPTAAAPPAGDAPAPGTHPARLADLDVPVPGAEPVAVRLPALGVEAPVVDVGVEPAGDMEIPEDVGTVGWYRYGPRPGEAGSAVIAGHVDGRTQGPGALFRLREMGPGDTVAVDLDDGTTRTFVVTAREQVAKDAAPLDELFRADGDPRLVLITCGGAFDAAAGRYEDNITVYAELLD